MVKRPRKLAVHSVKPPSPSGESRDYSLSTHYYDADNDRNEGWDHTTHNKAYLEPEYKGGQDYNQRGRSRGRSQQRASPSPDPSKRDDSQEKALDGSTEHHSRGHSPRDNYMEDKYEREGRAGRYRSRDRLNDMPQSPEPTSNLVPLEKPVNVLLVKNRPNEGKHTISTGTYGVLYCTHGYLQDTCL